jgi:hypothetical protein
MFKIMLISKAMPHVWRESTVIFKNTSKHIWNGILKYSSLLLQVTHKEFPCPKCHSMTNVIKPELPLDKWAETLPANTMMEALLESISLQVHIKASSNSFFYNVIN